MLGFVENRVENIGAALDEIPIGGGNRCVLHKSEENSHRGSRRDGWANGKQVYTAAHNLIQGRVRLPLIAEGVRLFDRRRVYWQVVDSGLCHPWHRRC